MRSLEDTRTTKGAPGMPRWLKIFGAALLGLLIGASGGAGPAFFFAIAGGVVGTLLTRPPEAAVQRMPPDWAPPPAPDPRRPGPDASPPREPISADAELVAVRRFLLRAHQDGVITDATFRALLTRLELHGVPAEAPPVAREPVPVEAEPSALEEEQPVSTPAAPTTPAPPAPPTRRPVAPPPPPEPRGPTVFDEMMEPVKRLWAAFTSELALHGFAYLGVLLVFVGILGFVIFAFAGVESGYRPVAELVIPVFLFGSAFALRRRGAPFVANALSLLGGAVTPIVAFAAFADGAPIPPDLEDAPLVVALTIVSLLLAGAYAFAARRVPETPLRYLVAPMVWVAAGVVGLAFEEGPSAAQMAFVTTVIVLVAVGARRFGDHPLAKPTLTVTVPGLVVGYALFAVFGWSEGWPPIPAIVAAGAAVLAAEWFPERVGLPWLIESAAVVMAGLAAATEWGVAPAGVAIAVAFVVLTEVWATRAVVPSVLVVTMAGVVSGVGLTAAEPAVLLAASLGAGVWAHWRYLRPFDDVARPAAMVLAAVMPAGAFWAVAEMTTLETALAVTGGAVFLGAIATRVWAGNDPFYTAAVPVAAAAVGSTAAVIGLGSGLGAADLATLATATGTAAVTLAITVPFRGIRVWVSGTGVTWALLLGLRAGGVGTDVQAAWIAVAAAAAVGTAIAWGTREAGHLGLLGHALGLAALVQAGTDATQFVALGAWTAGWVAETVAHETGRTPLTALLLSWIPEDTRGRRLVLTVAPVIGMVSLPFFLTGAAEASGILDEGERGRMGLLLAATAFGYGAAARVVTGRKPIAPLLASGGVILSGIAIAIAAPEPWPTVIAISATIAVVAVVGGELRRPIMTWFAWAVSAILAMLVGAQLGVPGDSVHLLLLGWGGALLLGGLAFDDVNAGRRTPGVGIRTSWLVPPVALAAVAVPAALAFRLSDAPAEAWPTAILAAVLYLVAALLLRAGAASAASYALVALGVGLALEGTTWDPVLEPEVLALFAAVLIAVSFVLERVTNTRDPWLGWDTAPLVVAHGVAAVALVSSAGPDAMTITWGAIAALATITAIWKAKWSWVGGGAVLVVAAIVADPAAAWTWAIAVAALLFGAAWRLRTGALTLASYALGTYGLAAALADTEWWPQDRPWIYVPWIAALLATSFVLERTTADRNPVTGWDLAPFGAAHGVAALALITTADAGHIPATFLGVAALSLAVSVWKRHWTWAEAGVAAAVAGSAALGFGWLFLTLVVAAAAHQIAATVVRGLPRRIAQALAAGLAGSAWPVLAVWLDWNPTTARSVTAWVGGGVALAAAIVMRRIAGSIEWAVPWAALAGVMTVVATVAEGAGGDRAVVWGAVAGAAALWSLATALSAGPLGVSGLREAAALLALGAGAALGHATEPTAAARVAGAVGGGLSAVIVAVVLWVRRGASVWIRPLVIYASVAHGAAILIAIEQMPERPLLVAALAAAGIEALALGLLLRRPPFLYAGLPLLLASWITYASESLTSNPQWFTVPIGLTILGIVEVSRGDSAGRFTQEMEVAEYVGIGFLVGSSLFQTLTVSPAYGLVGIVLGFGVILWAIATRIRRRAYAGGAVIGASALLMIAVPLAKVIPQFRGIALWATVIGLGLLMIVIAVTLERGKALVNSTVRRLEELMEGWQ